MRKRSPSGATSYCCAAGSDQYGDASNSGSLAVTRRASPASIFADTIHPVASR
jgi:hypothetical protein